MNFGDQHMNLKLNGKSLEIKRIHCPHWAESGLPNEILKKKRIEPTMHFGLHLPAQKPTGSAQTRRTGVARLGDRPAAMVAGTGERRR
jgi:hypothetical protein